MVPHLPTFAFQTWAFAHFFWPFCDLWHLQFLKSPNKSGQSPVLSGQIWPRIFVCVTRLWHLIDQIWQHIILFVAVGVRNRFARIAIEKGLSHQTMDTEFLSVQRNSQISAITIG